MGQKRAIRHPETDRPNLLKILAAFSVGVVATFGGAVVYSQSHQTWNPAPAALGSAAQTSQPAAEIVEPEPVSGSAPAQSLLDKSEADEHQGTTTIAGSPEQSSKQETTQAEAASRMMPAQSVSAPPNSEASSGPVQASTRQSAPSSYTASGPAAIATSAPVPRQTISEPQMPQHSPQPAPSQPDQQIHSVPVSPSAAAAPQPAPTDTATHQPDPNVVTVQAGTTVQVRLEESLSSDRNRTGDMFRAVLDSPLMVDRTLVAGKGAIVFGRVTDARKAPLVGGRADLALSLTYLTTAQGRLIRIDTSNIEQRGVRSGIVNTAKMATGAAVGAVMGALNGAAEGAGISSSLKNDTPTNGFMATKRTVVLPAGTQIIFTLAAPIKISEEPAP